MSIVLQSTGGGSVTLQEPSTASNFTQTLPAADGTLVLSGTTPTLNGITFPATQVPSADANTLDDYEEGTWTPTVTSGTGSLTSYTSSGIYTKVGRSITTIGFFTLTNVGTASGSCVVGGFPFTSIGPAGAYRGSIGICREDAYTGYAYQIEIIRNGTTANINNMLNQPITWSNSYEYVFTITYMV
jgi:hypothetical protein